MAWIDYLFAAGLGIASLSVIAYTIQTTLRKREDLASYAWLGFLVVGMIVLLIWDIIKYG